MSAYQGEYRSILDKIYSLAPLVGHPIKNRGELSFLAPHLSASQLDQLIESAVHFRGSWPQFATPGVRVRETFHSLYLRFVPDGGFEVHAGHPQRSPLFRQEALAFSRKEWRDDLIDPIPFRELALINICDPQKLEPGGEYPRIEFSAYVGLDRSWGSILSDRSAPRSMLLDRHTVFATSSKSISRELSNWGVVTGSARQCSHCGGGLMIGYCRRCRQQCEASFENAAFCAPWPTPISEKVEGVLFDLGWRFTSLPTLARAEERERWESGIFD